MFLFEINSLEQPDILNILPVKSLQHPPEGQVQPRMDDIRGNFDQRDQHKSPVFHPGMRDFKPVRQKPSAAKQQ